MASFLTVIDRSQKIVEIIWSEPVFIITRHHPFLSDSFVEEERVELRAMIEKCLIDESLLQCSFPYRLISSGIKMRLCMIPVVDKVLVFAWDEQNLENAQFLIPVQSIVHKFMNALKNYLESNIFNSTKSISTQFENIQKLNNDLINTRRMLEKANGQLEIVNRELNNRLVKDALTGLVSRYQYHTEIKMLIDSDPESLGIFAFIDIDNFKAVNDRYGHAIGDQYLTGFADRLKKLPFEKTIKMRISGDEFGVFISKLTDAKPATMEEMWENIRTYVLFGPIETDAGEIPVSISVGMAVYGEDTKDMFKLIEYADYAMYMAKRKGKNGYSIFNKIQYESVKGDR
jgi:diguanylate cyclase (GGDEF)-like protein